MDMLVVATLATATLAVVIMRAHSMVLRPTTVEADSMEARAFTEAEDFTVEAASMVAVTVN